MPNPTTTARPGLALGARGFVLAAVATSAPWSQESTALTAVLVLAVAWGTCTALGRTRVPLPATTWLESILVALVVGMYHTSVPALLAALAVPPFAHGLARGIRGALEALGIQVLVLVAVFNVQDAVPHAAELSQLFTWLVTGLGLGLVASFFVSPASSDDQSSAYLEARTLLSELNDLSARLVGGLDPASMAQAVTEEIRSALPVEEVVLHVERDGRLLPLMPDGSPSASPASVLAERAWTMQRTLVAEQNFAFLVSHSDAAIAVVSGQTAPGLKRDVTRLTQRLDALATQLAPAALRLDTAQLFAAFHDSATSQERQRLAREMHDGMAQDIASMGYVVDALIGTATPEQERALRQLRSMITRVVAEVRRSVTTLRTQAEKSESLGAAIASLARDLSAVAETPIMVTVDERTSRLSTEVEGELVRIAQEALHNAITHAGATSIEVSCHVDAPFAEVTIRDDGRGLQSARPDSYGLSIMRERAALVGAELSIDSGPGQGTLVTVTVSSSPADTPRLHPRNPPAHEGARQ